MDDPAAALLCVAPQSRVRVIICQSKYIGSIPPRVNRDIIHTLRHTDVSMQVRPL